jgi:MFS family permease
MGRGLHALIAAQFASALADNALLLVTIALLAERGLPPWWAPMLKFGFTASYVLLAPFVGPFADAFAKARVMAWMNAVKLAGAASLLAGAHPLGAYTVIGFGAAAYAPAKYGLVTELVPAPRLVAANGWLEVSVVCAALLGTVLGGVLVGDPWLSSDAAHTVRDAVAAWSAAAPSPLSLSMLVVLGIYAVASLLNLGVPDSGARYARRSIHPAALVADFARANRTLWQDHRGGLSLAVTTLFWGVGATLQFVVIHWSTQRLGLSLAGAAYLQAAVAVGVVAGASAAGRWVPLSRATQVLGAGVVLGLSMSGMAWVSSLTLAVPMLVVVGAVGGVLVVPMNALLQHRGHCLLSAGRSIAVQGFNENASVLAMLALYAGLVALHVPILGLMTAFGLAIAGAIALLMIRERRRAPVASSRSAVDTR